jgi:glucose/arabinose dehydrogenase
MKVLSKIKMIFAATAVASVMLPTAAVADGHSASKGMDVPGIGSMVIMSGLKNPWDMAFTKDGTMFFTEKCDGLSVKTASGVNKLYGMKGSKGYGAAGSDLFL